MVEKFHFGGGEEGFEEGGLFRKKKEEKYAEVIMKSKLFKEAKAEIKEQNAELRNQLDDEFDNILSLMHKYKRGNKDVGDEIAAKNKTKPNEDDNKLMMRLNEQMRVKAKGLSAVDKAIQSKRDLEQKEEERLAKAGKNTVRFEASSDSDDSPARGVKRKIKEAGKSSKRPTT